MGKVSFGYDWISENYVIRPATRWFRLTRTGHSALTPWRSIPPSAPALGAYGERVEDPANLPAALERAIANAPALIDVMTSQDVVRS